MREDAQYLFMMKDVLPTMKDQMLQMEDAFQEHKEKLKASFTESFNQHCEAICKLQQEEDFEVAYMMYSVLRTNIVNHKYTYMVRAYDERGYITKGYTIGELDVSFFYDYFEAVWQTLLQKAKRYVGKVKPGLVNRLMLECVHLFHGYVAQWMRYSILEATECEGYGRMKKAPCFQIQSGEYYEPCDVVYKEGQPKNIIQIKKWLRQGEEGAYYFEDFRDLDLGEGMYRNIDLRYTDLRHSCLEQCDLEGSQLQGAKFQGASLKEANLFGSMLHDASFEGANLTGADLSLCVTFVGKDPHVDWARGSFTGTSFRGADLTNTLFVGATLGGVDFTGAKLQGTHFEEAILSGSSFTEDQLTPCNLSREQLECIRIVR